MRSFLCLLLFAVTARADPFAVVLIDSESERLLGEFPFDRGVIAKGIAKIAEAKPKAIVLKFFYDLPKSETSDAALEKAICDNAVILQTSINQSDGTSDKLNERFVLKIAAPTRAISGEKGFVPLPRLARCARDVGFVDYATPERVPLLGAYQNQTVKSLYLCALEAVASQAATFPTTNAIRLRGSTVMIGDDGAIAIESVRDEKFPYLPFHQLLNDPTVKSAEALKDKIVIVGYDGSKIHAIDTKFGPIRAHRYFVLSLRTAYRAIGGKD